MEDLPPPLEDCSALLAQQKRQTQQSADVGVKRKEAVVKSGSKVHQIKKDSTSLTDESGYGQGLFQKGFLTSGGKTKSGAIGNNAAPSNPMKTSTYSMDTSSKDNVPLIRPKMTREEELRISQVQEALESDVVQSAWKSDALMEKVMKDPAIAALFAQSDNTEITEAIDLFSRDPVQAMQRYAHRADILQALRAFAGHFGDHLHQLGDQQQDQQKQEQLIQPVLNVPEDLPEHEKQLIRRVMADREVQEALKDQRVQQLLMALKTRPAEYAQMLRAYGRDHEMQKKIFKLMEVGLLQVQR